ncbi:hypothetical protein DICVIV_08186 [Dictyocaulus viviparus]|uniref:Uncharacterized protein n=1 Tax=Dictyocaulus viviparus TaxID=29172 RepID=A0A0D8XMP3_DICVI|nr:hypothetical protein DICVIV_08186 [Dictyocaulus viviparus]
MSEAKCNDTLTDSLKTFGRGKRTANNLSAIRKKLKPNFITSSKNGGKRQTSKHKLLRKDGRKSSTIAQCLLEFNMRGVTVQKRVVTGTITIMDSEQPTKRPRPGLGLKKLQKIEFFHIIKYELVPNVK